MQYQQLTNEEQIRWLSGLLDRERCCVGKIKYSQKSAEKAALAMERKTGHNFDVYGCLWCGSWHIGHSVRP